MFKSTHPQTTAFADHGIHSRPPTFVYFHVQPFTVHSEMFKSTHPQTTAFADHGIHSRPPTFDYFHVQPFTVHSMFASIDP
eukprot:1161623-Pelagomonas_calceolata.AAC.12